MLSEVRPENISPCAKQGKKMFGCHNRESGLTKKAEPPPTRSVGRDSGTDNAIGGWLQRLVRPQKRETHNKIWQIPTLANPKAPHLLAASNRRELNPG
jgi:hypothetical protein